MCFTIKHHRGCIAWSERAVLCFFLQDVQKWSCARACASPTSASPAEATMASRVEEMFRMMNESSSSQGEACHATILMPVLCALLVASPSRSWRATANTSSIHVGMCSWRGRGRHHSHGS